MKIFENIQKNDVKRLKIFENIRIFRDLSLVTRDLNELQISHELTRQACGG